VSHVTGPLPAGGYTESSRSSGRLQAGRAGVESSPFADVDETPDSWSHMDH